MRDILISNISVCQCCMLQHCNAECCAESTHGGDGVEPWSDVDFARYNVTMGLLEEEHSEHCTRETDGECDCERTEFSRADCEGCGSRLAGERHAFTLWRSRQRFSTGALPA